MRSLAIASLALVLAACASPGFRATPTYQTPPGEAASSQPSTSQPSSQPTSAPSLQPTSAPSSQPSVEAADHADLSAALRLMWGQTGELRAQLTIADGRVEVEDGDLEEVCARRLTDGELATLEGLVDAALEAPRDPGPGLASICNDCQTYQLNYRHGDLESGAGGLLESVGPNPETFGLRTHLLALREEIITACQAALE